MAKKKIAAKKVAPKVAPKPVVMLAPSAPGAFVDKFSDRKEFFSSVRDDFGPLRQGQVDGFENIFGEWTKSKLTDDRWLAYQFATAWHETAATMQPIAEYGRGKGRKYGRPDKRTGFIYYGRGLVQLTWFDNYKAYGIEKDPEKACDPAMAAHIMLDGMTTGRFTSKKLSDYFNDKKDDAVGARRIINGTDKAQMIAGHHAKFLKALRALSAPKLARNNKWRTKTIRNRMTV